MAQPCTAAVNSLGIRRLIIGSWPVGGLPRFLVIRLFLDIPIMCNTLLKLAKQPKRRRISLAFTPEGAAARVLSTLEPPLVTTHRARRAMTESIISKTLSGVPPGRCPHQQEHAVTEIIQFVGRPVFMRFIPKSAFRLPRGSTNARPSMR
jgi:hypothetical protein